MRTDELLAPFVPTAEDPFDLCAAGHLFRRTSFGASLVDRRAAVGRGVEATVDSLFVAGAGEDVDSLRDAVVVANDEEKLIAWRAWRLIAGRERLRERMSLFWHDHFATSVEKVRDVGMFVRHLSVFDEHGLGRFDGLLLAVSRDPAMIRWLDNETNLAGSPNENYAREILELFALGRGAYTERDVQEAARAFTGWTIRDGRFHFARRRHDGGAKAVLGREAAMGGEDVVALAAAHPASARFLARKLCETFVHPEPTAAEIEAVAVRYAECDRDVGDTLRTLLRSRMFFSSRARRSRIKAPVDYVIGTVRSLGATASPRALSRAAADMGQRICAPPSVEGWPRERDWLTSATWLARANFAARLFAGDDGFVPSADELLGEGTPTERAERAIEFLHDGSIGDESRRAIVEFLDRPSARGRGSASRILHAVQLLPEGQLL